MFENATRRLVNQIDPEGVLIPVSRLNDSEKLKPMAVVIKRPPVWFWQKTKYRPTAFTINHLLQGENIQPVLEETEFLKYKEKHEGNITGFLKAGLIGAHLKAEGHTTSKLSSSLGTLRKESVNMQRLLQDSKTRMLDLEHKLIQQTWSKSQQVLTIVMERIFTTCECTFEYSGVEEGSCSTILKALGIYPAEVRLKHCNSLQYDTSVAIEIPPATVLAYSVVNLDIKCNGHYELSAWFDGFVPDEDTPKPLFHNEDEVDGLLVFPKVHKGSSLSVLKEALAVFKAKLSMLTHLPAQSRSSLLLQLHNILLNRTLLSTLEDKLKDFMLEVDDVSSPTRDDRSNEITDDFLDLLQSKKNSTNGLSTSPLDQNGSLPEHSNQNGTHTSPGSKKEVNYIGMSSVPAYLNGSSSNMTKQNGSHLSQSSQNGASVQSAKANKPVLTAMHLLISAAEGLTDDGLILLESLCTSDVLSALKDLVNLLTDTPQPIPVDNLPDPLWNEDIFLKVVKLFSSSKVTLKKEKVFWAETQCSSEDLPLVLCIAIHGLACLIDNK